MENNNESPIEKVEDNVELGMDEALNFQQTTIFHHSVPHWVKGGVLMTMFGALFMIVSVLSHSLFAFVFSLLPGFFILTQFLECYNLDLDNPDESVMFMCNGSGHTDNMKLLIVALVSIIIYFALGALLGFIYGKLKKRAAKV